MRLWGDNKKYVLELKEQSIWIYTQVITRHISVGQESFLQQTKSSLQRVINSEHFTSLHFASQSSRWIVWDDLSHGSRHESHSPSSFSSSNPTQLKVLHLQPNKQENKSGIAAKAYKRPVLNDNVHLFFSWNYLFVTRSNAKRKLWWFLQKVVF